MNLFVYGTLMVPRLMAAITGRRFSYADAVLKNFARYGVRNASYPGLVSEKGVCTPGVVYFDNARLHDTGGHYCMGFADSPFGGSLG